MSPPSALFVSSGRILPVEIIKNVLNGVLPDVVELDRELLAYEWFIDNKYYTAKINLCSLTSKKIIAGAFSNSVEAIVIYFDSGNFHGLELAESWLPFLDVYDPEIKILVCKNCADELKEGDTGICKLTAQEWCIQRGFELVELEPSLEDIDPEDDFQETTGVERIRQSLNAHRWSNLVLKCGTNNGNVLREANDVRVNIDLEEGLDVAEILSNLRDVRERLATLPFSERVEELEGLVSRLWSCIATEDDEL